MGLSYTQEYAHVSVCVNVFLNLEISCNQNPSSTRCPEIPTMYKRSAGNLVGPWLVHQGSLE